MGFYYIAKNYEYTSEVMREAALSLKVPLTIICSDKPPFQGLDSVRWKQCMKTFAEQLNNRKYLMAKNCGHYIFIDNPGLVINEIVKRYRH